MSHVGRTLNAFKVTMKLQTFLFQMVVTLCISVIVFLFSICENMVLQNPPIIYTHPVLVCLFPSHMRAAFSKLCSGLRLSSTVS